MIDCMEMTKPIPKELHRYFKFYYGYKMLETSELFFSNLSAYNDIYECVPATSLVEAAAVTPERAAQVLKEMWETEEGRHLLSILQDSLSSSELTLSIASAAIMSSSVSIPIIGFVLAGIYTLYKRAKKNEREQIESYIINYGPIITQVRTCCFTLRPDNILMWSHYAEWNAGMVISFNTDVKYWVGEHFKPVIYSDSRVPLPDKSANTHEYLWKLLTTKARCWEYEDEWRMIRFNMRESETLSINPSAISAIRLGIKVSQENRDKVLGLRDKIYPQTPVLIERRSCDKFALEFDEL